MYKNATRAKLRFETNKGDLTVEDLWDLPLTSNNGFDLDTVAKAVNRQIKASEEESFVAKRTAASTVLVLKLDILKDVIATKLEQAEEASKASLRADRRRKLIDALAEKQDESLKSMSEEDIKRELEELEVQS